MTHDERIRYAFGLANVGVTAYDYESKDSNVRQKCLYDLARTQRMFEYDGLPDTIKQRPYELGLQCDGIRFLGKVNGQFYAVEGGMSGIDPQKMPTYVHWANPALVPGSGDWEIGKDCIVMRNDSMFMGLLPLMLYYNTQLAENDLTMRLVDIMARINTALAAGDDVARESARVFLENLINGKLTPIADAEFLENGIKAIPMGASGNRVGFTDLIEYQQYLRAGLANDLGIDASYNMKREALNSAESSTNKKMLFPLVDDMLACRQEDWKAAHELWPELNVTVKLSGIWADEDVERKAEPEGGEPNEEDTGRSDSGLDADGRDPEGDQ